MADTCSALMVALGTAVLAFFLSGLAVFGVYTLLTPGWPYFVEFVAGGSILIAIVTALINYTIAILLQGK